MYCFSFIWTYSTISDFLFIILTISDVIFFISSLTARRLSDSATYVILKEMKNGNSFEKIVTRVSFSPLFWRGCFMLFDIWNTSHWLFGQKNKWLIDRCSFVLGIWGIIEWKRYYIMWVWLSLERPIDWEPGYYYFFFTRGVVWRRPWDWDGFDFVEFVIYMQWPVYKPLGLNFLAIEVFLDMLLKGEGRTHATKS